jgi:hypothetical protein
MSTSPPTNVPYTCQIYNLQPNGAFTVNCKPTASTGATTSNKALSQANDDPNGCKPFGMVRNQAANSCIYPPVTEGSMSSATTGAEHPMAPMSGPMAPVPGTTNPATAPGPMTPAMWRL